MATDMNCPGKERHEVTTGEKGWIKAVIFNQKNRQMRLFGANQYGQKEKLPDLLF